MNTAKLKKQIEQAKAAPPVKILATPTTVTATKLRSRKVRQVTSVLKAISGINRPARIKANKHGKN